MLLFVSNSSETAFLHFFAGDVVVPGVQRPLPVLFSAI